MAKNKVYEVILTEVLFRSGEKMVYSRGKYTTYNKNGKAVSYQNARIYRCDNLDDARKNGYTKTHQYQYIGYYAVATIYHISDDVKKKIGEVFWSSDYTDRYFTGVMWVPAGKGESDWVNGVKSNGTLSDQKYKLT